MNFDKEQFAEAVRLWTEWNGKINVVSRKDIDCLFEHHILHSLAIAEYLHRFYNYPILSSANFSLCGNSPAAPTQLPEAKKRHSPDDALPKSIARRGNDADEPEAAEMAAFDAGIRILDVGCGGGFPGIPLAMVMPEVKFTLCDSIGKKVMVAQAVADGLGLKNVECVNARVETLPGKWDWIVSRAVTSLDNFYPWVKGRFTKGILYLKGGDVAAEIAQMCSRCKVDPSKVTVWPISNWLEDDYFAEKFVIEIRKA